MRITTTPLKVVGYGTYQRNKSEGGGDMTRRDGSPVEYVELHDSDTTTDGGVRRFTLDPTINGSRPAIGAEVIAELLDWCEPKARNGAGGRAYIASHRRNVVTGFSPAK